MLKWWKTWFGRTWSCEVENHVNSIFTFFLVINLLNEFFIESNMNLKLEPSICQNCLSSWDLKKSQNWVISRKETRLLARVFYKPFEHQRGNIFCPVCMKLGQLTFRMSSNEFMHVQSESRSFGQILLISFEHPRSFCCLCFIKI